jgi:predicted small integral membrane protein
MYNLFVQFDHNIFEYINKAARFDAIVMKWFESYGVIIANHFLLFKHKRWQGTEYGIWIRIPEELVTLFIMTFGLTVEQDSDKWKHINANIKII